MFRRILFLLLGAGLTLAAGCGAVESIRQDQRDHEAIQAALNKYVAERSGIDLAAVNMEIQEFNTDRDRANILVKFTAKQGGAAMQKKYSFAREAGAWTVKSDTLVSGAIPGAGLGAGDPSKAPAANPKKQ